MGKITYIIGRIKCVYTHIDRTSFLVAFMQRLQLYIALGQYTNVILVNMTEVSCA